MSVRIPHTFVWFSTCLIVVFVTSVIMSTKKKFSIFNLEFPKNSPSIRELITNIKALPPSESTVVFMALKGQLYVDFIFMPATYMGVLLLCFAAACHFKGVPEQFFVWLALLQSLAWSLDITENIFLLGQINRPRNLSSFRFGAYRLLEVFKWGLSCIGFLLSIIVIYLSPFILKHFKPKIWNQVTKIFQNFRLASAWQELSLPEHIQSV